MRPIDLARLLLLAALWGGSFLFIRVAAPVLAPLVPLALPPAWPTLPAIVSAAALALLCTALAYILYFRLILDVGPLRALTVTFLIPVFGVLWSGWFLGEPISASTITGCGVILVGTALVTGVRLPFLEPRGSASVTEAVGRRDR